MKPPIAVFLCDRTGVMARPWSEAGYECWCVDTAHSIRRERIENNIHYVWGDVRSWCPPEGRRIAFLFVMSPCTDVAGSGARDFGAKGLPMLCDALELFAAGIKSARWSGAPWAAENSVGVISTHFRKPDYYFHPWEYAGYLPDPQTENTSKKTCLWTGGGFVMPSPRPAPAPHRQDCWLASPSDDRGDIRSVTPAGFARAVFQANARGKRGSVTPPTPTTADGAEATRESELNDMGYTYLRQVPLQGLCGLMRMMFTTAIMVGLDDVGYVRRFCYADFNDARDALADWTGEGDPSGPWIKEKPGDRSGPGLSAPATRPATKEGK